MYFSESENINTKREKDVGMKQYDWSVSISCFQISNAKGAPAFVSVVDVLCSKKM